MELQKRLELGLLLRRSLAGFSCRLREVTAPTSHEFGRCLTVSSLSSVQVCHVLVLLSQALQDSLSLPQINTCELVMHSAHVVVLTPSLVFTMEHLHVLDDKFAKLLVTSDA